jgi:hypothetical protein
MNAEVGIRGFGKYGAARRELAHLLRDFDEAVGTYPCLGHQLISPLNGPLTSAQWSAFFEANSQEGDWQEWDGLPGGESCSRFFGNKISLTSFTRMADKGMMALAIMNRITEASDLTIPAEFLLRLPSCDGYHGWLQLLYQTARCFSSPWLFAEAGFWGCSGQCTGEEDSRWVTTATGISYPVHPFFEELRYDLFQSSAEAIRLWLDPDSAFGLGDRITDSPIYFPPEPERNGPSMPNAFWVNGKRYDGFSPAAWRLLECLWGKEAVSMDDAIRHVYGGVVDGMESALRSTQKRLSRELDEKGCPVEVHRKEELFFLVLFNQK